MLCKTAACRLVLRWQGTDGLRLGWEDRQVHESWFVWRQAPPGEVAKVEPGAGTSIGTGGKGLAGALAAGFVSRSDAPAFPVGPAGFMSPAEVDTSLDSTRRPPAA